MGKIPKIKEDICIGCGACVAACPKQALEMVGDKAKLTNIDACDSIEECIKSCPVEAIEMVER